MLTFKEYVLKESHTSKYFDELVDIAKENGCTVKQQGDKFTICASKERLKTLNLPASSGLGMRLCHRAEKGAHPLRKWLKNILKIQDKRLQG